MITALCFNCRHLRDEPPADGFGIACDAFPEGIPEAILEGNLDHSRPVAGDHGIQFDPVDPELVPEPNDGDGGLVEEDAPE